MASDGPTVRQAVFDLLRIFRLTTIFGNPGSTELAMFRDLPDDFRYVLGLQESLVVAMADGFARGNRNAAVVQLHSAIGVGNAMGSIYTAYQNRTPLVVIAGQQARSLLSAEPFQYSDQAAQLPQPYVKWSVEPARAEDVPAAVARAYYLATAPPQGPVLVSVPSDDWDRPADLVVPRPISASFRADGRDVAEIAAALAAADAPGLVVGPVVDQDGAFAEVVELAERLQARVWSAPWPSRCSFPENHALYAGVLPPVRELIRDKLAAHD
ncbi:thiamine pyrophosphate-binding protein [Kribbella sp. NPDC056861]|uniref:thiamine pyrophosphate-binding protein n=1 Tax=Kribbella sp. NPDC056861 TaxID=3154857 RepID=UPI003417F36E